MKIGRRIGLLCILLAASALVACSNPDIPQMTWTESYLPGNGGFTSIAQSASGVFVAACVWSGDIFLSQDSGSQWSDKSGAGTRAWTSVAMSSDGLVIAACSAFGSILVSTDSGATWSGDLSPISSMKWSHIAMSANGDFLAACGGQGVASSVFTSSDRGSTWIDRTGSGSRVWQDLASSADGSHLGGTGDGYLYLSKDYGSTWTTCASIQPLSMGLTSLAFSANGNHIAVCADNGGSGSDIYVSTDGGASWTDETAAGKQAWGGIAISADGSHIAAYVTNLRSGAFKSGDIFLSADGGATWTDQTNAGSQLWTSIAISSDGSRVVASTKYDGIYLGRE